MSDFGRRRTQTEQGAKGADEAQGDGTVEAHLSKAESGKQKAEIQTGPFQKQKTESRKQEFQTKTESLRRRNF
jgi:hypothetical protein